MACSAKSSPAAISLHGFAASGEDKNALKDLVWPNVGLVTAFQ